MLCSLSSWFSGSISIISVSQNSDTKQKQSLKHEKLLLLCVLSLFCLFLLEKHLKHSCDEVPAGLMHCAALKLLSACPSCSLQERITLQHKPCGFKPRCQKEGAVYTQTEKLKVAMDALTVTVTYVHAAIGVEWDLGVSLTMKARVWCYLIEATITCGLSSHF